MPKLGEKVKKIFATASVDVNRTVNVCLWNPVDLTLIASLSVFHSTGKKVCNETKVVVFVTDASESEEAAFGRRFVQAREQCGLSRGDLAKISGLSLHAVESLEDGSLSSFLDLADDRECIVRLCKEIGLDVSFMRTLFMRYIQKSMH